jgi:diaminohydroxyphosphoribosylaminopyrimidine deaminase/5-amino-6-(5-phosphoribosylamino)uracil reductase
MCKLIITPYGKLVLPSLSPLKSFPVILPEPNPQDIKIELKSEAIKHWPSFLSQFFSANPLSDSPLKAVFDPIRISTVDSMMVVGQLGQTIDGRIATITGQSRYVNGHPGLVHLHQLRALVDAVVVGIGTVLADDPQLNVRLVEGKHPARVVIDPKGRLDPNARIWVADGAKRLWIVSDGLNFEPPKGVKIISLPMVDGHIEPAMILKSLSLEGLNRILIEGGAETISRFLQANCLDRLHIIVAPIVMGSGRASFNLKAIEHMDQASRLKVQTHLIDSEVLFDCDFSSSRIKLI